MCIRDSLCAVLAALALGLSTLEGLFPISLLVPLPGVKLGLANIVTVFALYQLLSLIHICFTLFILAMAEAMEQNTIGTTTQNIILMNSVPKNTILLPKLGANAPTRQPATMPASIHLSLIHI